MKRISFGPIHSRYADMIEDVVRILMIQTVIHAMFVLEGSESLGNRQWCALVMYTLLGVSFYHFIARQVFVVRRRPADSSPGTSAPAHA
jgi:hypothetical protein